MVTRVMLPLARLMRRHASGGSCRALVGVGGGVGGWVGVSVIREHCTLDTFVGRGDAQVHTFRAAMKSVKGSPAC